MILVTRLDDTELIVNAGHITMIERTPDTVIELTTGQRIMVRETVEEVVARALDYRCRIVAGGEQLARMPAHPVEPPPAAVAEESGE